MKQTPKEVAQHCDALFLLLPVDRECRWHAALSGFAACACACRGTTCRMLNTILFQTRAGYVWATGSGSGSGSGSAAFH